MEVKLTSVESEDYKGIIKFLSNFDNEKRSDIFWENRLLFWWDQNPAFTNNLKRGWILKDTSSNSIVGFIANIPTFFIYKGRKIIVHNASTWRVKKKYRSLSIQLLISFINYSKQTILFDTTPSNAVKKILKSLKFNRFPNHKSYIFFIPFKLNRIFKYRYSKNIIAFKLLKFINPIFISYYQFIFSNILNSKKHKVKIIKNIDERFDELWARSRNIYLNTNVRDSNYLKWYCNMIPDVNKIIFGHFENKLLNTFIIFQIIYEKKIKSLNCLDIWGLKVNINILKLIMREVLKFSYKNDIDIIYIPSINTEIDALCKKLGLIKKKYDDKRFYKSKDNFLEHPDLQNNYFTFAQGDLGL